MKNLFTRIFPLLALALLFALTSSGNVYALSSHELLPKRLSNFNRSFGLWVVTTESEFNDGVLNNVDTSSSPGDVKLEMPEDWYDASWSRRAPVTISNSGSALTEYQVRVDVNYDDDMQSDFDDIRFTEGNGTTLLSYWLESYSVSTSAVFWVNVSSVPAGDSTIYMYYGNPSVSTTSNGTNTFVFFDDFSGDLSKWTIHIDTDVAISSSVGNPAPCLEISGGTTSSPYGFAAIGSDATYTGFQDGVIEADIYPDTNALPEIIFRGNYPANTGYKGRWDCRSGDETPWLKPPYSGWGTFGTSVPRFGIAGQWQEAKLVISGSTFEIYNDGSLKSTATDTSYSGPGEIGLANHYGAYCRFDNVRVRKYADPAPTTSVGSEEILYYPVSNWYDASWSRRAPVTISNSGSALTDYQVRVDVTYDADMQSNFDDIRFTASDGTTLLSYWTESYTSNTSAVFWVKVSSIPSGSIRIYMYYGNSEASAATNFDNTFTKDFGESGLVGLWHMDEGSGTNVSDSSGQGNHGTITNGDNDEWVASDGGYWDGRTDVRFSNGDSLDLDGSDDYIQTTSGESKTATHFTWECWFKTHTTTGAHHLLWEGPSAENGWGAGASGHHEAHINVGAYDADNIVGGFYGTNEDASEPNVIRIDASFSDTTNWHHVAFIVTNAGSSPSGELFLDGVSVGNDTGDQTARTDWDTNLRIGRPGASQRYFDGMIDEVRIYNRALSADEIKCHYERRKYADPEPGASVEAEEAYSPSTIASNVYDTSEVNAGWDLLGWDKTLLSGTDISFEVRASDTIFLKGNGTPAWQDASVLPTGRYQQWRATLTTTDSANTPVLHEVWDLYSW
ncbi:MAG TPA: DUF2341 domain-containing protein [Dehalococcoidia bacterium]|nr:DUF2341 domain-containing protein [Dehalococcoidia bacterium]